MLAARERSLREGEGLAPALASVRPRLQVIRMEAPEPGAVMQDRPADAVHRSLAPESDTAEHTAAMNAQLETAARTRQQAERDATKLTKDATYLLDAVRGQVETLAVQKKEFESFDERLRSLHTSVGDA